LGRRIARKNERSRTVRNEGRNKGNNPFRYFSFSSVVKKSGRDNSVKCPSHVK
jgi:hypothetical protein